MRSRVLWALTATLPLTVTLKTSGSSEWLPAQALQVVSRLLSAFSQPDTAQPCLLEFCLPYTRKEEFSGP